MRSLKDELIALGSKGKHILAIDVLELELENLISCYDVGNCRKNRAFIKYKYDSINSTINYLKERDKHRENTLNKIKLAKSLTRS